MPNHSDLALKTEIFFNLHWPAGPHPCPSWAAWVPFLSPKVANYNRGGCYALFANDELQYIGLGVGNNTAGSLYADHGISARLNSHVVIADRDKGTGYKLRERWGDLKIDAIYTIGFETYKYLAPALEFHLIQELNPPQNRTYRKRQI